MKKEGHLRRETGGALVITTLTEEKKARDWIEEEEVVLGKA
jgi:hypothetical protein